MTGIQNHDCFRLLFQRSPDASWLVDPVGPVIADCNATVAHLTGWRHREELVGLHPAEIAPERQPDGSTSRSKTRSSSGWASNSLKSSAAIRSS